MVHCEPGDSRRPTKDLPDPSKGVPQILPMFDAQLTRILPKNWVFLAETAKESAFCLVDESDFVLVRVRRGRKRMVFPGEEKPLHPPPAQPGQPRIREFLARAIEWQSRLQTDPAMTQTALAKEAGVSRVRVVHILNLLRLAPEIQRYILAMPPATAKRALVTENRLRSLIGIQDQELQVKKFRSLLGASAATEAVA